MIVTQALVEDVKIEQFYVKRVFQSENGGFKCGGGRKNYGRERDDDALESYYGENCNSQRNENETDVNGPREIFPLKIN
jgi:hypothetical protein